MCLYWLPMWQERVESPENGNISRDVLFCEENFSFSKKPMLLDNPERIFDPAPTICEYEAGPVSITNLAQASFVETS